MLVVISPAKRLDWTEKNVTATDPAMQLDAVRLAKTARVILGRHAGQDSATLVFRRLQAQRLYREHTLFLRTF